jgi:hypothetical protein
MSQDKQRLMQIKDEVDKSIKAKELRKAELDKKDKLEYQAWKKLKEQQKSNNEQKDENAVKV